MKLPKKKVLKCLWVMKYVDIVLLRPATIPEVIVEIVDIGILIPDNLPLIMSEDIIVVMLVDMYRAQETIHYSSSNRGTIFDVEGRGGYISHTIHSSSNNPGNRGRFFTSTLSSRRV